MSKLTLIKILHTIVWLLFNVIIFYMLYAVILNKIDILVWIGFGIIIIEGIVLKIFNNKCPLTNIAGKYTDSTKENFDIYLPNWLAKYNKQIYSSIMVIILIITVFQLLK